MTATRTTSYDEALEALHEACLRHRSGIEALAALDGAGMTPWTSVCADLLNDLRAGVQEAGTRYVQLADIDGVDPLDRLPWQHHLA